MAIAPGTDAAQEAGTSLARRFPPGPDGGFLGLGFLYRFRRDPLKVMTELSHTFPDVAYIRMGPVHSYFVNSPDLIHQVLLSKGASFQKLPMQAEALTRLQGPGLVSTEGEFWQRQRRLVQPALHPKRFGGYCEVVVDKTQAMLDGWEAGAQLNVEKAMTHLIVKIIGQMFYDVDVSPEKAAQLAGALDVLGDLVKKEFTNGFLMPPWLPVPSNFKKRKAAGTLNGFIWDAIRDRRASRDDKGDLLSMLLLAVDEEGDGGSMTEAQVHAEAMTLFNAAHDSTGAALTWTWYCLSRHPDVEARLLEEVDRVLGRRRARYEDAANLPFTTQVIKESMRLYPPVPILFTRQPITGDVSLGPWRLPKGSYVFLSPWMTHRDPRSFEDPERFNPDRFDPERARGIHKFAFFPFGGGPHVCIGSTFAQVEMTLIVATILQRYRLERVAGQGEPVPVMHVSIRPEGGMHMKLTPRA